MVDTILVYKELFSSLQLYNIPLQMYGYLYNQSSIDGHKGCFWSSTTESAVLNNCVK